MGWYLACPEEPIAGEGWVKRFDARYWTVDFPRPMMAAVTTTAADALRVDVVFYGKDDLAGLIWAAEDRWDHPLLRYETSRDFRGCRLRFRWRSGGVKVLDALNGPTLTIEGRDAAGVARAWYVRLWNYAEGAPDDAAIAIDFDALDGGFLIPAEAQRVWAGDIDRMFVSIVAPDYDASAGLLAAPAMGWAEMTGIVCEGPGSTLKIGEGLLPAHGLRIATGYDDAYNLTPARVLGQILALGYRGIIDHYVGMSHYFRLRDEGPSTGSGQAPSTGSGQALRVDAAGGLNVACAAWHRDFAARARTLGYDVIFALSFELLDVHAPDAWKQRDAGGGAALTGWVPPSTLVSPASAAGIAYLGGIARDFMTIAVTAGLAPRLQIGEPWWWTQPGTGRMCLYDAAATTLLGSVSVAMPDVRGPLSTAQKAMLDAAGVLLASATQAVVAAARAGAPGLIAYLLVYLPTVLDAAAPEAARANVPVGWAKPAFDVLQLEDYDWVIAGNRGATARGVAAMTARLGYPIAEQHYFAGFVLSATRSELWEEIDAAAAAARARGTAEVFVWALPQVARDGFVHFDEGSEAMEAFDDVAFPLAIGRAAMVTPAFSTAVVTSAGGHEQRQSDWADARMHYDAGPGVRSEADIAALIAFFRARRGAARGFRFADPFDDSSAGMSEAPGAADQAIGVGDGVATRFALVKRYGEGGEAQLRWITRPRAASVRVSVDAIEAFGGWTLAPGGVVAFDVAPAAGAAIAAGFRFDVAVRFASDQLEVSRATYLAGEAASVPLIEVRERFL